MFISVVLPAPFSPTMPWIEPRRTVRSTSLLARTAPNRLAIPRSVTAGAPSVTAFALFRRVVGDLDGAGDDCGPRRLDARQHRGSDELLVVLVHRIADA